MGDSFTPDEIAAGMNGGFPGEGDEQDEEPTVHSAASTGESQCCMRPCVDVRC